MYLRVLSFGLVCLGPLLLGTRTLSLIPNNENKIDDFGDPQSLGAFSKGPPSALPVSAKYFDFWFGAPVSVSRAIFR